MRLKFDLTTTVFTAVTNAIRLSVLVLQSPIRSEVTRNAADFIGQSTFTIPVSLAGFPSHTWSVFLPYPAAACQ